VKTANPPNAKKVSNKLVADVIQALSSFCSLPSAISPPAWIRPPGWVVADPIDPPCPAHEILSCQNGLIQLPAASEGLECEYPHSPLFFSLNSLRYTFAENEPDPVHWFAFLKGIWPEDLQAIEALQEFFGYCLLPDTSQQKILMIVGPKRSGKGTITRVLCGLVGTENTASPTLGSLGMNFGLWPLLGKSVAVISDARLPVEPMRPWSPRTSSLSAVKTLKPLIERICGP